MDRLLQVFSVANKTISCDLSTGGSSHELMATARAVAKTVALSNGDPAVAVA